MIMIPFPLSLLFTVEIKVFTDVVTRPPMKIRLIQVCKLYHRHQPPSLPLRYFIKYNILIPTFLLRIHPVAFLNVIKNSIFTHFLPSICKTIAFLLSLCLNFYYNSILSKIPPFCFGSINVI